MRLKSLIFLVLFPLLSVASEQSQTSSNYVASIVVDSWSGARSAVQLWNPPDSGVVVYLDVIHTTHSKGEPSGFDLRGYSEPYGTFKTHGFNKQLGSADSVAEIRWGNSYGSDYGGKILYEMWTGGKFDDHLYEFATPIIIPPGHGVVLATAHDSAYLVASFQYREVVQ